MAVSHLPDNQDIATITAAEFPPCTFHNKKGVSSQIANHLKKVLEAKGEGCPVSLRIPSTLILSHLYQRSIMDVLDGLYALKQKHYEYVVNGLDAEIILQDPLCRAKTHKNASSRQAFPEQIAAASDALLAQAQNPMMVERLPRKVV